MVHALLATGAVHQHLARAGLRCESNLIVETGTARDPHHFACLIGFGATAVYPYLAYQTLHDLGVRGILKTKHGEVAQIGRSYRRGIKKGLLKIISKMGISTIGSYRGAQLFEIVGLDRDVVDLCFAGTPSRIGGAGFADLHADARAAGRRTPGTPTPCRRSAACSSTRRAASTTCSTPTWSRACSARCAPATGATGSATPTAVNERPTAALRDLLEVDASAATPIAARRSRAGRRRSCAASTRPAMSLGALSPEAHEALAIAMNRLGGRSNSGEGGEDPARYGTDKVSKIKQIASGRFGVTPEYLVNAEVLQIKIAQGAKPGEGGQLPGHKVNELIARLRYAMPGIGLISPPPHHDIYSIEDLAQLIFDLKQVNPQALVSVKLVSHAGVGTIADRRGQGRRRPDHRSPATTAAPAPARCRRSATPARRGNWACRKRTRRCVANDLRDRVILQTDGGLKTGLDVVKAALLGAESFGFGTAPMIALGCKYLRICHLNNCATGVATQDERAAPRPFHRPARARGELLPPARRGSARSGWRSWACARSASWSAAPTCCARSKATAAGSAASIWRRCWPAAASAHGGHCGAPQPAARSPTGLAAQLDAELADAIAHKRGGEYRYAIRNTDRSIGARLSGAIARAHGDRGMSDAPITLRFDGTAGQSFGAFNAGGLQLELQRRGQRLRRQGHGRRPHRDASAAGRALRRARDADPRQHLPVRRHRRRAVRRRPRRRTLRGAQLRRDRGGRRRRRPLLRVHDRRRRRGARPHRPELRRRLHRRHRLRARPRARFRRPLQPRADRHPAHRRRRLREPPLAPARPARVARRA